MTKRKIKNYIRIALLLCILQVAGIAVYAQEPVQLPDTLLVIPEDTIHQDTLEIVRQGEVLLTDSIINDDSITRITVDSISIINAENLARLEGEELIPDSTIVLPEIDLTNSEFAVQPKIFIPNSTKATWLAVIIPGGGQIYNRKYWKLPIIYGGFAGCAYALSWNSKTYSDYARAYRDIMDGDPRTNSYYDFVSDPNVIIDEVTDTRYKNVFRRRRDTFRRYRDLSIFAFIGVYIISIVDAYVDAELSNFDIGPDLSLRVTPVLMNNSTSFQPTMKQSIGMQCSFTF